MSASRRARLQRVAIALLLGSALGLQAGCASLPDSLTTASLTGGVTTGSTASASSASPSRPATTDAGSGVDIKMIRPSRSDKVFAAAPEPSASTWSHVADGYGIIRDAKAEAYLQGIVRRLMDHWHGDRPERIGIFIQAGDTTRAKATPFGDLLIPIAAFDDVENEDQLAALIGHELGHIVLRHHEKDKQAKQIADISSMAVGVVFGVSAVRNSGVRRYGSTREFYIKNEAAVQRDTLRSMSLHAAFITLTQDILLTAYSRSQEYEADSFGLRVAGTAGWDHTAIVPLIQRWHDAEDSERAQHLQAQKSLPIAASIMSGIGDVAKSIIASHPSAADRKEHAIKQIREAFPDVDPRKTSTAEFSKVIANGAFAEKRRLWKMLRETLAHLRAGDYVKANASLAAMQRLKGANHPESRMVMATVVESSLEQDREAVAYRLLSTADYHTQPATYSFYVRLATLHARHNNPKAAMDVIAVGERYYGQGMLPARISVWRAQIEHLGPNRPLEVQQAYAQMGALSQQCQATGDKELIETCRVAYTGRNPEADYKNCGGVISVIAALSPGGDQRCGSDQSKAATPAAATTAGSVTAAQPTFPMPNIFGGLLKPQ